MKAKVRWTIELEYPVPEGIDHQFYLEEHHCQKNLLIYLYDQIEPGLCNICDLGKVEFLGIVNNGEQ